MATYETVPIPDVITEAMKRDGWNPPWYLEKLYTLASRYRGQPALEVGVWKGRTAYVLAQAGVELHALDIDLKPEALSLEELFENVTLYRGDSTKAFHMWPKEFFSFIHIDGDHTAPTVNLDVSNGWAALRPGGILCGDDINEPDVAMAVFTNSQWPLVKVYRARLWTTKK